MNFREFLEEQENIDESLWDVAKGTWGVAKGVANAAAGAMTMGDEAIAKMVGDGARWPRMRRGREQFGRGMRQIFVGEPKTEAEPGAKIKSEPEDTSEPGDRPKKWYVKRDGKDSGPFTSEEVRAMAGSGRLRHDDLIWKKGMGSWRRAGESKYMAGPREADAKMDAAVEGSRSKEKLWRELSLEFSKAKNTEERRRILSRMAMLDMDRYMKTFGNARTRSNRRRERPWSP